ncbi:MAG: DUF799 family lipoprotein [Nitrospirota bacterium]|nr:DUF799 family lipoprotein [Nitrospirota bacterium]
MLPACVGVRSVAPNPANPIRTVAILPFVNNSNDVGAPTYVREQFAKELERHQYRIKPLVETDQLMKEQMGVTLGSQLDMTTPQKLGEVLGVDGVFIGSLEEFNHKITGIYNVKRVRVRIKLADCKTGRTVWKNGIGVKSVLSTGKAGAAVSAAGTVMDLKESAEDLKPLLGDAIAAPWIELPHQQLTKESDVGVAAAAALGERLLTGMLKMPLFVETNAAVQVLLNGSYPYYDNNQREYHLRAGSGAVPAGPGS